LIRLAAVRTWLWLLAGCLAGWTGVVVILVLGLDMGPDPEPPTVAAATFFLAALWVIGTLAILGLWLVAALIAWALRSRAS
jgi:hypothetical protein